LRQRYSKDDEFVAQAKNWYAANSSRLEVNVKYEYLAAQPPPMPGEDRTNLFVSRSK
jgi:hypothetical protein